MNLNVQRTDKRFSCLVICLVGLVSPLLCASGWATTYPECTNIIHLQDYNAVNYSSHFSSICPPSDPSVYYWCYELTVNQPQHMQITLNPYPYLTFCPGHRFALYMNDVLIGVTQPMDGRWGHLLICGNQCDAHARPATFHIELPCPGTYMFRARDIGIMGHTYAEIMTCGMCPPSLYFTWHLDAPLPLCNVTCIEPMKQVGEPWSDDQYDNQSTTIDTLGCLLTACAELVNQQVCAQKPTSQWRTDPGALNEWLQNPNHYGFDAGGGVDPAMVALYARSEGQIDLEYPGKVLRRDDRLIDSLLCLNLPVIVNVKLTDTKGKLHNHFVVVKGRGSCGEYLIEDPGKGDSDFGNYNHEYVGVRPLVTGGGHKKSLKMTVPSRKAAMEVEDEAGAKTGIGAMYGTLEEDIPGSVFEEDPGIADVNAPDADTTASTWDYDGADPVTGVYNVDLRTLEEGAYSFVVSGMSSDGTGSAHCWRQAVRWSSRLRLRIAAIG